MTKNQLTSSETLVETIVKGMQEVKGNDIVTIDLRKLPSAVCDFFVICHGNSNTQVEALADSVEREVFKTHAEAALHKEGRENAEWILLDYFNVVVHVFQRETRMFYGLEKLWADAPVKEIEYGF
jgi:ribosome-associated protein